MTLKDVKFKWQDTKSPYVYPSRTIEIITTDGRILTPTRSATLYEHNQQASIPATTPIKNQISFSVKKMNKNKLMMFLKGNGLYKNWAKQMTDDEDRMKHAFLRSHIVQPTTSPQIIKKNGKKVDEIESGVDYLVKNSNEREKFTRLILKMQNDSGLDVISVPYLRLPLSEYKKYIRDTVKSIRDQNKEPLIVFDLQYEEKGDKFSEAISFLIKEMQIKLISFPNRAFATSAISYDTLSQNSEADTAFITFDASRIFSRNNIISKMHCDPFIGTDIYAVKAPRYVPPEDDSEKFEKTKESIQFFNNDNLLVEPSQTRIKNIDSLLEEMGEPKNNRLSMILGDYDSVGKEPEKIAVLNALSKFHELRSSTTEFNEKVQKRIKAGESSEYINEKSDLKSTLTTIQSKKRKR